MVLLWWQPAAAAQLNFCILLHINHLELTLEIEIP